jgi:peptidoglycan hydrolase-like protein with peptidoglycan-binding domain
MVPPPPPSSNDAPKPSLLLAIGVGFAALIALSSCSVSGTNAGAINGDVAAGLGNPDVDDAAAADQVAVPTPTAPATTATTVAPTTAAPSTAAPTTLSATTIAPTTAVPTTVAPTTTLPSPAVVWVGGPESAFVAVGDNSGSDTARIQQRLIDLGFWLNAVDGDFGLTTSQAVMAFQKFSGIDATGNVNQATADALTTANWRAHGLADAGTLVEIDKDRQLLFIVQNGRTVWIFNTSTGDGQPYTEEDQNTPGEVQEGVSVTRNGLHAVYRERAEGWWEGDLGRIYRPKYFSGGQAVHGSNSVPNYPASHGCVRVTVQAMDFIWDTNLLPMDTPVWVHGAN